MKNDGKFANIVTQLQGQAGVWAVAAQLAIRGHIPIFPGVDYGWDLMIENGLRLQIKTARLNGQTKRGVLYPGYSFNLRKTSISSIKRMSSIARDWTKVERKAAYEGRWDLLDVNRVIETVAKQVLDLEEKI